MCLIIRRTRRACRRTLLRRSKIDGRRGRRGRRSGGSKLLKREFIIDRINGLFTINLKIHDAVLNKPYERIINIYFFEAARVQIHK